MVISKGVCAQLGPEPSPDTLGFEVLYSTTVGPYVPREGCSLFRLSDARATTPKVARSTTLAGFEVKRAFRKSRDRVGQKT